MSATTLEASADPSFRVRRTEYIEVMREAEYDAVFFSMDWNGALDRESAERFNTWLEQEILPRPEPVCLFCSSGELIRSVGYLVQQH